MLSFATEFPINHECGSAQFMEAIKCWVIESPHTHFSLADFAAIPPRGEWSIKRANEQIDGLIISFLNEEATAVRRTIVDGTLEWITTIVFSRQKSDAWVGTRTFRESHRPARRLPPAKKPIIVRQLLETIGGELDGGLRVSQYAHQLKQDQIYLAANLISGKASCHLPVVYISCGFDDEYIVDTNSLAWDLSGMAHVLVEPNRVFSRRLQLEVDSENVYGGTIGIYWPNGGGRRSFFLGREFEDAREIKRAIVEEIRTALMNRRPLIRCTWSAVQEASSRNAYSLLKETGSKEIEKYVEVFDAELSAKNEQIMDAEKEISRLKGEIRNYELQSSIGKDVFLRTGFEQNFYSGELVQIVIDAIREAAERVPADSRRRHVLKAITEANSIAESMRARRDTIKALLRGYTSMDNKTKKGLEKLGFSIEEDGKHYKLVFQDDDRYTYALPKSGSDRRGGLNAATDISRLIF